MHALVDQIQMYSFFKIYFIFFLAVTQEHETQDRNYELYRFYWNNPSTNLNSQVCVT